METTFTGALWDTKLAELPVYRLIKKMAKNNEYKSRLILKGLPQTLKPPIFRPNEHDGPQFHFDCYIIVSRAAFFHNVCGLKSTD